jgi:hypothetical protein
MAILRRGEEPSTASVAQSNGHDPPGLIDELVPGFAAMRQDILIRFENAVGEPVVAHELPDIFHRIELRGFWRQGDEGDVWRHDELRGHMPAGLIDQEHGMSASGDGLGDLSQMQRHRFCIAGGQNQSRAESERLSLSALSRRESRLR